jgi:GNAT superfamily N-acetyltransferase
MLNPNSVTFPEDVRLLEPPDVERAVRICLEGHMEGCTISQMDEEDVRRMMQKAAWRKGVVVAVSPAGKDFGGLVGLQPAKIWYGADDQWYWTDLGIYVLPDYRKKRLGLKLMRFCQWWATHTGAPVYFSLLPHVDLDRKIKLFSRYGRLVGATFLIDGG